MQNRRSLANLSIIKDLPKASEVLACAGPQKAIGISRLKRAGAVMDAS
jgi:hypothetical protein